MRIYVVNYPLEYFAAQLAPTGAEVELPVAAGVDPAFWNPSVAVIGDYQRADLIVLNGAGYARWTRYATLPEERIVVSTDGCGLPLLKRNETVLPAGEDCSSCGGKLKHLGDSLPSGLTRGT